MDEGSPNQPAPGGRFGGGGNGRRPTQTASPEPEAVEGTVTQKRNDKGFFTVKLDDGHEVYAFVSEIAKNQLASSGIGLRYVRLGPGRRVLVEVSPYNPERGRIVRRLS